MTQTRLLVRLLAFFLLAAFADGVPVRAEIQYTVSLAHPEQHLFHVTVTVPDVQDHVDLQMAAWDALYQIRDFSSHVQRVSATVNAKSASIDKLDKLTWRVQGTGTIAVSYDTFWDDPGPFNSQLNSEHAFINPAMILLFVPSRKSEAVSIEFRDWTTGWKFATSLEPLFSDNPSPSSRVFLAPDFSSLADAPIEISNFTMFQVGVVQPPVFVAIHGDGYKKGEVESALRKIVTYELKLMDGAPYSNYTFIFHIGNAAAGAGGGMEHANSTAIYIPSGDFLANVSAHEFFHLWNVKRIRPASLEPLDRTHEMYTRSLWFAEGVTNTYASYALVRSGIWSHQEFLQDLGTQITELESRPAERWQSAEQSSLDAWLEKYVLYNQPENSISYYTKGQVLGFLLDVVIRDRTDNQHSLDDVLRSMNTDFAREGKYYRDSLDIRLESEKLTGGSLSDFFDNYVAEAAALPYSTLLSRAGLELHTKETVRATLGFLAQREPNAPWVVVEIQAGSPAANAGLQVGDEILRWNGAEVPRRPERWVAGRKAGEVLHLRVRRDDEAKALDIPLGEIREKVFQVAEAPGADSRARRIRDGILHGATDPVTASTK